MTTLARQKRVPFMATVGIVAATACAVVAMAFGTGTAHASGYVERGYSFKELKSGTNSFVMAATSDDNYLSFELTGNQKVSNVKSSNPRVLKIKYSSCEYDPDYKEYSAVTTLTMKKPGTTKLSYKIGNKKFTRKIKIYKYTKPIKQLKIGKKSYAKKLMKTPILDVKSALKGKVNVKVAKGWKLVSMDAHYEVKGDGKYKKIKNGKKLPANTTEVGITIKHVKSNTEFDYVLF